MSNLTWETLNPGEYIKAAEMGGKPVTMRIASIDRADFISEDDGHTEKRGVVCFVETDRKWVLNTTNIKLLAAMWPNLEDAIGKRVTLVPEQVQFGRETVEGIRVKGSPDIAGDIKATVKLPRRKATTRTLTKTGATAQLDPAPAADETGEVDPW